MTPPPTLGERKRKIARSGSQKILGIRSSWSLSGRDPSCLRHSAGEARTPRGGLEGVLLVVVDLRAMLAMMAPSVVRPIKIEVEVRVVYRSEGCLGKW
jgi:hypothetical protein